MKDRFAALSTIKDDGNVNGKKQGRDKTKYLFDGRVCLKNKLVLEVVRRYVDEHSEITFNELRSVFYDKLQGAFGVVRVKSNIEPKNQVRYFYKVPDTIELDDGTEVVVSNQWGLNSINAFIALTKSLGYIIKEINDGGKENGF
ncbi:MAG: hypothetical protein J6X87_09300 [Clostridia bacterium]|nr:hypothetical protein [Clostridia bacterium]